MPHYKDGTEAKVVDVVRGRGYNVPYEIVGVVKHISPNATSFCNIEVLHAVPDIYRDDPTVESIGIGARLSVEYGEAAAFELVSGKPR